MSSSDSSCYTVIFESTAEYPSASELRQSLEKGSDDVKIDTLRKIIISTINGNPQARIFRMTYWQWTYLKSNAAHIDDANHPIRNADTKQAIEETIAFLLGGVPEVRREWEVEAGDDSCGVRDCFLAKRTLL